MRLLLFIIILASTGCHISKKNTVTMSVESNEIQTTINDFVQAGDERNVSQMEQLLNPQFRVAINQFQGGEGVTVIDRQAYLDMLAAGKLGGSSRLLEILSVEVQKHTAFVRAKLTSPSLIFETLFTLAEDKEGHWTIVSDNPFVRPKAG